MRRRTRKTTKKASSKARKPKSKPRNSLFSKKKRDVGQTKQGWWQGVYEVKNPAKYMGSKPPYYRSGLEKRFMTLLDESDICLGWLSEEPKIPYVHPVRTLEEERTIVWNYHPDFLIKREENGTIIYELIELKPYKQTIVPKPSGRGRSKKLVETEQKTWAVNQAKWEAAIAFCKERGWTFKIVTEKDF